MKVLVIGAGGREHSLVWKIRQSPRVDELYCAPGNAGIAEIARCVPIASEDIDALLAFARDEGIGLTVVGPEQPLIAGIVDVFQEHGLRIFGPTRQAAMIEGSKAFAKELMKQHGIPTAFFSTFTDPEEAKRYITEVGAPIVVKADGLCAGKGVIVCQTLKEALDAVDLIMVNESFGDAGAQIVVEEYLQGEEASFIAFTDGTHVLPLASSQDHKPVFDGDKGPNTGGMGAYSPAPVVTEALCREVMEEVMKPAVAAMAEAGRPYSGALYAGLMIDETGKVKVLEFNARLGDPEAQPLMVRLKSDIVPVLEAVVDGDISGISLDWDPRPAVCVVMASKGYPRSYKSGMEIQGLELARAMPDTVVFHAGTKRENGRLVTAGGRVLGVTCLGETIRDAIDKAYRAVESIAWDGVHYRKDIGRRALDYRPQR